MTVTPGVQSACLTRLERYPEAEKELDLLATQGYRVDKLEHARGLQGVIKGTSKRRWHVLRRVGRQARLLSAFAGSGDVLTRLGKNRRLQVIGVRTSCRQGMSIFCRLMSMLSRGMGARRMHCDRSWKEPLRLFLRVRLFNTNGYDFGAPGKLEDAVEHARVAVTLLPSDSLP